MALYDSLQILQAMHITQSIVIAGLAILFVKLAKYLLRPSSLVVYPLINGRRSRELFVTKQKERFVAHAKVVIEEGFAQVSSCAHMQVVSALILVNSRQGKHSDSRPMTASNWFCPESTLMVSGTMTT
jgi:hypothetical protein